MTDNNLLVETVMDENDKIRYDKLVTARELVIKCLSEERANRDQSWIEVGWCLHNIDNSENMFNVWMEFTNKSEKANNINIEEHLNEWNSGWTNSQREKQFTIRSLHMWAKEDNPEEYKKIMNDSLCNFVISQVDATHTHIAILMKRMYQYNYCVSTDNNKDKWFRYNGTHWESSNGIKHELKNKLSSEVAEIIIEARRRIRDRMTANSDQSWEIMSLKRLIRIEAMLTNTHQKDSIIKECESVMYTPTLPVMRA